METGLDNPVAESLSSVGFEALEKGEVIADLVLLYAELIADPTVAN
jgi:hypothetical protein